VPPPEAPFGGGDRGSRSARRRRPGTVPDRRTVRRGQLIKERSSCADEKVSSAGSYANVNWKPPTFARVARDNRARRAQRPVAVEVLLASTATLVGEQTTAVGWGTRPDKGVGVTVGVDVSLGVGVGPLLMSTCPRTPRR